MSIGTRDRESYWAAVSTGDARAAQHVVDDVRSRAASVTEVLFDLVMPTQERVGRSWATNQWSVADEHAATAISEAIVLGLTEAMPPPTRPGPPVVVACVEREWHALPALAVTQALRSWGVPVRFLGASTSGAALVGRVLDLAPPAVLLSASLSSSLPRVRRQVEAVRGTGTPVVVGGRAFDTAGLRAQRLGATAYAASVADLRLVLDRLPVTVPPAPPLRTAGAIEAHQIAVDTEDLTRDVIAMTDTRLGLTGGGERAVAPDDWRVVLANHVPHVVGAVAGALITDDPTVLVETRGWLDEVLSGRGADPGAGGALWDAVHARLLEYPEAIRLLDAQPS